MFDKIFNKASVSRNNNFISHQEKLRLQKEKKAKEESEKLLKNVVRYKNVDYRCDNCSPELLRLIDKYEFEILSYERNLDNCLGDECILEIYRCRKNNWTFEVKNITDYDIGEGIFSVCNLKNISTGQEVNFYCDLGCRNTFDSDLEDFLKLLTFNSERQYIEETYKEFFDIPRLLISKGILCYITTENYTINDGGFVCKIDYETSSLKKEKDKVTSLCLKFKHNAKIDNCLLISKEEDNNSSFKWYSDLYVESNDYFEYTSEKDIDELIKCIDCFYEQINNRIGYFENGKYYSNYDVLIYFKSIMDNNKIFDKKNHNLIRLEDTYGGTRCCANKYRGREIFVSKNLIINDAGFWSEGDEINNSHITVEYDTTKDDRVCVLSIKNYIYKSTDTIYDRYTEDGFYTFNLRQSFLVDEVEIKGSFSYIMDCLDNYITNILNIYEILV